MNFEYLSENIKYYRDYHGLSQKDLAHYSGLHYVTISKYENGKMRPGLEQLQKLADAMNLTVTDLLLERKVKPKKIHRSMIDGNRVNNYLEEYALQITAKHPANTEQERHDRKLKYDTIHEVIDIIEDFIKGRQ